MKVKYWRELLIREMNERGVSQSDFCRRMKFPKSHVCDVLKGRKPMNIRMAVAFEFLFIGTAEKWMGFQITDDINEEKKRLGI